MLKKIDIVPPGISDIYGARTAQNDAGWIIKKERLAATWRASDIVIDAQARAEALLVQAQSHAREYCEAGLRKGIEMGVQAAMVPLLTLLEKLQSVKEDLRAQACRDAQSAMHDFLSNSPVLVTLLDTVLASHLSSVASPLRITVPGKADVSALSAHCIALGLDARIDVSHEGGVFSASWDGHLWEVNVESLVGPLRVGARGQALQMSAESAHVMCRDALVEYAEQLAGGK